MTLSASVQSRHKIGQGGMKQLRIARDRAVKTTVEQTLMRGLVTAFSVCSSGAASICQRASMKIIGHTIHTRIPHRGPVSSSAQQQMSIQVDTTLLDECNLAYLMQSTAAPPGRSPTGRPPSRGRTHGSAVIRVCSTVVLTALSLAMRNCFIPTCPIL